MSSKQLTISPQKPLKPVMDYDALRELGMQYIESLGSSYWTDYNTHDPGITSLEVLSYALTELGYRMQFPMADVLTEKAGEPELDDTRFTARTILTTHPVTTIDYRKLLIDLNGVANAWLSKVSDYQPRVYADCETKELVYERTEHPMPIDGLWDVLLELENDDAFGNLNASGFEYIIGSGSLKGKTVEFVAHERPDLSWGEWINGSLQSVLILDWEKETNTQWSGTLELRLRVEGDNVRQRIGFSLYSRGWQETNPDQALKNQLKSKVEDSLIDYYLKREAQVVSILEQVNVALQDNRNLCEDFRKVALVSAEEVSFCADIEADPNADLEDLEARIVFAIERYLSPEVPFYSLKELIDEGIPTEEIFDGPALEHGFVKTTDVEASALRSNVYASDIINLIMDIDGVKSVSNFVMSKFDETGSLMVKAEQWALSISTNHKPRYAQSKSAWLFFKNKIPFATRDSEVRDILDVLKAEDIRTKLLSRQLDIDLPRGKNRELHEYFSIQNDFPVAYGVGANGAPANATTERKNQAKQFQGYLQFFDQVLANFLAQVEGYKQYVSLEDTKNTYYSNFLDEVPGADQLYVDELALRDDLPKLAESTDDFFRRRNRILDHLLSRFQESFNNYVLMLYSTQGDKKANQDLISDKIDFLKSYPEMSSRRFTALNVTQAHSWPYGPDAGLKERITKLGGIGNSDLDYLMPIRIALKQEGPPADDKWRILWKNRGESNNLFRAAKVVIGKEEARIAARKAFQHFVEGGAKVVKSGQKYRIVFGQEEYLMSSANQFENQELAGQSMTKLFKQLTLHAEGMHVLEHVLLRPRTPDYVLMDPCLPDDCQFCGNENPYSFKLSVILPYWPTRFRQMHYRRHIEELVHTECPAHLLPKVCWADPFAWQELEDAWQSWLLAQQSPDVDQQKDANARLIRALEDVETVYPEAVLHDCEDDKDENPVILNQTKLGIF
jgi:hypothetical protein